MNFIKPESIHKDDRRTLTHILSGNIKQINTYDCNPCTLGNHSHDKGSEYFYLISGQLHIGNEFAKEIMNPGDIYVVLPNENHIVEVTLPSKFITFLTFNYETKEKK